MEENRKAIISRSISRMTKAKFDILLKSALEKTAAVADTAADDGQTDGYDTRIEQATSKKAPVPLPRSKTATSSQSSRTAAAHPRDSKLPSPARTLSGSSLEKALHKYDRNEDDLYGSGAGAGGSGIGSLSGSSPSSEQHTYNIVSSHVKSIINREQHPSGDETFKQESSPPILKERKRWNKEDPIIFIGPGDDNLDELQPTDNDNDTISLSASSRARKTNRIRVIVHQSPSSTKSKSKSRSNTSVSSSHSVGPTSDNADVICVDSDDQTDRSSTHVTEAAEDDADAESVVGSPSSSDNDAPGGALGAAEDDVHKKDVAIRYEYKHIIGVTVHRMDNIILNGYIQHPCVKVYMINIKQDGGGGYEYLLKSDAQRHVCHYYESDCIDYVTPIMTQPFDFKHKRSYCPEWEETIVLNEDFEYLINQNVIVFFEIIDFVNFTQASQRYKHSGKNGGWYRIAWAFIKLLGKNNSMNVEKTARLQLFKPGNNVKRRWNQKDSMNAAAKQCDVYEWWSQKAYKKYPATLYVTIKRLEGATNIHKTCAGARRTQQVLRSRNPIQCEYEVENKTTTITRLNEEEGEGEGIRMTHTSIIERDLQQQWNALQTAANRTCQMPNELLYKINAPSTNGCFVVRFSNDGTLLATTGSTPPMDLYYIHIYLVRTGECTLKLNGHNALIYELNWSHTDQYLLSASADCIVYIWDVQNKCTRPVSMLPHPSYVYCALFYPESITTNQSTTSSIIVTGCFDHVIRVWRQHNCTFELLDELENHNGYVTALCSDPSDPSDLHLYSGDSIGCILRWSVHINEGGPSTSFIFDREYKVREVRNKIVNTLVCPRRNGQRLVIQSNDGIIRMMDVFSGCILQWFSTDSHSESNVNLGMVQTRCALSSCGTLLFAPHSTCAVHVYHVDTGALIAIYHLDQVYMNDRYLIHCIDFNRMYNIVVFAHYGHYTSILLYKYAATSSSLAPAEVGGVLEYIKEPYRTPLERERERERVESPPEEDGRRHFKTTFEYIINKMDKMILPLKSN